MAGPALAQQPPILEDGDLAVTGFPGTTAPPNAASLPAGETQTDETFIDTAGASLRVFDVSDPAGAPQAQVMNAPIRYEAAARDIGQVFGVAIDDADPANIYVSASAAHGLNIVAPDRDGDGRPERLRSGTARAQWMQGQWGDRLGGGPGSVYRIDGRTGNVSLFAQIAPGGRANSGPGLGNIAFDPVHGQFYVSDRDTGFIHRLDRNGRVLGRFDHGQDARPRLGLAPVAHDPSDRMDITSSAFDATDPATWGRAAEGRRVWGLTYHGGRLYYASDFGPQVWSVAIADDGRFSTDIQWELDVSPDPTDHPISDIDFDEAGRMYLTQRGGVTPSYDYAQHHDAGQVRVLRFSRESPDDPATPSRWQRQPEEYAIGFPGNFRNTAGGIAIGYGYEEQADGSYTYGPCDRTLWTSGDALRDSTQYRANLSAGGPLAVHGLQGNEIALVRPANEPPWQSRYVDYDGQAGDPDKRGHVGDVAVVQECGTPDLRIEKRYDPQRCDEAGRCTFIVRIVNAGEFRYSGRIRFRDTAEGHARLQDPPRNENGWTCEEPQPGLAECDGGRRELDPGEGIELELVWRLPQTWSRPVLANCAELDWAGIEQDDVQYNDRICTYVPRCEDGDRYCSPDLELEKFPLAWNCDWHDNCPYVVRVTNVGARDYTGPVVFSDTARTPGTTLSRWRPDPPWRCSPAGASRFDCRHPSTTLAPGENVEVVLWMEGPPLDEGYRQVRNCSTIDWQTREPDNYRGNDYACADIPRYPPGHDQSHPELQIGKTALPNCARLPAGDWACTYVVEVQNVGGAPYNFGFRLRDIPSGPGAARLVRYGGDPGWNCTTGSPRPQTCTHPAEPGGLQPGESLKLELVWRMPATAESGTLENCARMQHDRDDDGTAETLQACDTAVICTPGAPNCPEDITVTKVAAPGNCAPGELCSFRALIQNIGTNARPAGLPFTDTLDLTPQVMRTVSPAGTISCSPGGSSGTLNCQTTTRIPPGDHLEIDVGPVLAEDTPEDTVQNCLEVNPVNPDAVASNNRDCATAFIAAADLWPRSPSTTCERGHECHVYAEIRNDGARGFNGTVGLRGSFSPSLPVSRIDGSASGLACSATGSGWECRGSGVSIGAGDAAHVSIVLQIPPDFGPDRVPHNQELFWPVAADQDRTPSNDRSSSTIRIEGRTAVSPSTRDEEDDGQDDDGRDRTDDGDDGTGDDGPPPGRPDLAVSKRANAEACEAGQACGFGIRVSNAGNAPWSGPIELSDTISPAARLSYAGPGGVSCSGSGSNYRCTVPGGTLAPGETVSFTMSFVPGSGGEIRNCVGVVGQDMPDGDRVLAVQRELNARGFRAGPEDGLFGPQTQRGIRAYQRANGLRVTGQVDAALLSSLFGGADANPANDRACATVPVEGLPACTGGRVRTGGGDCVCPSDRPRWTGQECLPPRETGDGGDGGGDGQTGPLCTGGTVPRGSECVCPDSAPVWNGQRCVQQDDGGTGLNCTGGRVPRGGECACPDNRPFWTGERCAVEPQGDGGGIDPGDVIDEIPELLGDGNGDGDDGGGGEQGQQPCPPGQVRGVEGFCREENQGVSDPPLDNLDGIDQLNELGDPLPGLN
ncbi:peptidoglycan-binding protein [Psychromarinibacter sp. C21-152]|uniref:Peptidoglycan-binding protein n=1 Tax=Psychromarinibacter sediminicola TaxID=3033385 RepID=A0AAE3NP31_9RHOB|nr:peptidoglycan-binding protein [Psychromarinibacter sediminicola]MDF0601563.1 peptidoglycan-binding protein [Psychromarinibacter sediminicola]